MRGAGEWCSAHARLRARACLHTSLPPPPLPWQVHKINRFTQAQTASLQQRLSKLQERAALCETDREKSATLAVRCRACGCAPRQ